MKVEIETKNNIKLKVGNIVKYESYTYLVAKLLNQYYLINLDGEEHFWHSEAIKNYGWSCLCDLEKAIKNYNIKIYSQEEYYLALKEKEC